MGKSKDITRKWMAADSTNIATFDILYIKLNELKYIDW